MLRARDRRPRRHARARPSAAERQPSGGGAGRRRDGKFGAGRATARSERPKIAEAFRRESRYLSVSRGATVRVSGLIVVDIHVHRVSHLVLISVINAASASRDVDDCSTVSSIRRASSDHPSP